MTPAAHDRPPVDASPHGAEGSEEEVRRGAGLYRLGRLPEAAEVLATERERSGSPHAALQLGRTRQARGAWAGAEEALEAALAGARARRDLPLAVAALTALGEGLLARGHAREAVERLGEALGLTEWSRDARLAVAPLAGLAEAHAAWRNPAKGLELARRAHARADATGDPVLRARAALALGGLEPSPDRLREGERLAEGAPHRPLWLRLRLARLGLEPDPGARAEAVRAAREMGAPAPEGDA